MLPEMTDLCNVNIASGSGRRNFKSLWGPNGTKTIILISNKQYITYHKDALDARFGLAKKRHLNVKRMAVFSFPCLVFPSEIEMAIPPRKRIKTNGQSFWLVTLISRLFGQILLYRHLQIKGLKGEYPFTIH